MWTRGTVRLKLAPYMHDMGSGALFTAFCISVRVSYAIFSFHCRNINAAAKANAQYIHNTDTLTLPTSHLPISPTNL